jgi:hypothetical protein
MDIPPLDVRNKFLTEQGQELVDAFIVPHFGTYIHPDDFEDKVDYAAKHGEKEGSHPLAAFMSDSVNCNV